jgi:GMP synthase (glutamine-hydrolysing)
MQHPVLIVLHQEHSTPGRIGLAVQQLGYTLDMRRPRFGDALPATMAEHSAAIIFGGPMSANDGDEFIRREIEWVGVPLRDNKPFLGICLGAQICAKFLGGKVFRHPSGHAEVGYYPVRPTAAGLAVVETWPECVYQWRREGFDLPYGSEMLAEGDIFEVQAIRFQSAFALQFHPEVTHAMMHRWMARGHDRLEMPGRGRGIRIWPIARCTIFRRGPGSRFSWSAGSAAPMALLNHFRRRRIRARRCRSS